MAGPYQLTPGGNVSYPTWHAGKSTKLCVQNLDSSNLGKATIELASRLFSEDVVVNPSAIACIDRYWAGNLIHVNNTGSALIRVWTE